MNGAFFSKEVLGEQIIGGGLVYTGAEVGNNFIAGLVGANNGARVILNTGLKLVEGFALAHAEDKATGMWKDIAHGAKIIIPGTIPFDFADWASRKYRGVPLKDYAASQGQGLRRYISTRISATRSAPLGARTP